jgi:transcription initiation factor IIE alpha subunit
MDICLNPPCSKKSYLEEFFCCDCYTELDTSDQAYIIKSHIEQIQKLLNELKKNVNNNKNLNNNKI